MLADLSPDPAFREFFKLQEGFEWNVAQRLLTTLDWLVVRGGDGSYDMLIVNALDLIQGVLLLHPPSRVLFQRSVHMNVRYARHSSFPASSNMYPHLQLLLDLLEPINSPAIQCATIITLVVALLDMPQNIRVFEALDGLLTVTSLFKSRETGREVKFRLTEFLYFYLTPETPNIPKPDRTSVIAGPELIPGSPGKSKLLASGGRQRSKSESGNTLSVDAKKQHLDRYLPGVVDELLKDLDTYKPFGGILS